MAKAWPAVRLGEALALDLDRVPIDPSQSYPMVGVLSFGRGLFERETIENGNTSYRVFFRLKADHVVMSQLFGWEGALALSCEKFAGKFLSPQFPTFACREGRLDRRFLGWLMRRPVFWADLASRATGMGDRRRTLNPDALLACEIPLPPLVEQRRVVARVEELAGQIREACTLRNDASTEANAIVSSALSRVFDYPRHSRLPRDWAWAQLKDLIVDDKVGMTTGPFGTLLQKSDILSAGVPVLGIANVAANRFVAGFTDYVAESKARALSSYELMPDDIVIARSGTVGRSCVIPKQMTPPPIMSTNLIRVRLDPKVFLPDLLCRLLNGSKLVERYKDAECRGSSRTFFTHKILLGLWIPVPPIDEQRTILSELSTLQSQVDALAELQMDSASTLIALLPAILDRAFKGELV